MVCFNWDISLLNELEVIRRVDAALDGGLDFAVYISVVVGADCISDSVGSAVAVDRCEV